MTVRIATWNLERGRTGPHIVALQEKLLEQVEADVQVLTEVPAELVPSLAATSTLERSGRRGAESWVGIRGAAVTTARSVRAQAPLATVALAGSGPSRVWVYGSVLPWLAARRQLPEIVKANESAPALFGRILAAQVRDIQRLRASTPEAAVIWAGDFNQTLEGPNWGGSKLQRELLEKALGGLDLVPWNAHEPHASEGMCAIDLICGPKDLTPTRVERIEPKLDGHVLSDHAGYVLEF